MNIAAAMMSTLLALRAAINAENGIGSICTVKPASLPTSVMRSTISPWMVWLLVSRKVKGMQVGVLPTVSTCSAKAGSSDALPQTSNRTAATTRTKCFDTITRPCTCGSDNAQGLRLAKPRFQFQNADENFSLFKNGHRQPDLASGFVALSSRISSAQRRANGQTGDKFDRTGNRSMVIADGV